MDGALFFLSFFAILGAIFLGQGISGMVISQSCCFPPDCAADYVCDGAEPMVQQPFSISQEILLFAGVGMLAMAIVLIAVLHRRVSFS